MKTDTRIQEIRDRLEVGTEFSATPWRRITNTAGDRPGVVDAHGCIVTTDTQSKANFLAHAPTDIEYLLSRLEASS